MASLLSLWTIREGRTLSHPANPLPVVPLKMGIAADTAQGVVRIESRRDSHPSRRCSGARPHEHDAEAAQAPTGTIRVEVVDAGSPVAGATRAGAGGEPPSRPTRPASPLSCCRPGESP